MNSSKDLANDRRHDDIGDADDDGRPEAELFRHYGRFFGLRSRRPNSTSPKVAAAPIFERRDVQLFEGV
jgi:hypothetical protein